jgi:hypothetical protein
MQFTTVRFCPQWGQNVMRRPAGSAPLQYRHCSPACGTIVCEGREEPPGDAAARGPVLAALVLAAVRRGADCAGIAEGAVEDDDAVCGGFDTEVAAAARGLGMRWVVSVAEAFPAPTSAGSPAAAPFSKRRTAAGDKATCEVENSRNAPGSGFGDASSRASRCRISSFTTI